MTKQTATKFTIRKLLGALSLAAAITAFSPLTAHAQNDRPGNDMAHQERNPSQHPELFTATARSTQAATAPEVVTVRRTTRRNSAKVEGRANFFVTPATPVRTVAAAKSADVIGNDAPHQERNPSAHPELFVLGASR